MNDRRTANIIHQSYCIATALLMVCGTAFSAGTTSPHVLCALPIDSAMTDEGWEINGLTNLFSVGVVKDEILDRQVLEITRRTDNNPKGKKAGPYAPKLSFKSKATVSGTYVAEALIRFIDTPIANVSGVMPGASTKASLSCGSFLVKSKTEPAYVLEGGTAPNQFSVGGKRGGSPTLAWTGKCANDTRVSGTLAPFLKFSDVSPFSTEAFRLELEAGLAATPELHKSWIPFRLEVGPKLVRMYCNGILVMESPRIEMADGPVELTLKTDARIANLTVRATENKVVPFISVPLDFRYNAAGMIDLASLNKQQSDFAVDGIPFVLSSGGSANDHVDVGASVFRFRMATRYAAEIDPRVHTHTPNEFEPGRIMLAIPQRAYARAWVLAGSDDNPLRAPVLTLRFYKPNTDWATDTAITVPAFTSNKGGPNAKPISVKAKNGKNANLWLIPIELDSAELAVEYQSQFANIELTKEVKPNLAYPDPCNYSYQPAGLPSSVQIYGLTFEEAPVKAISTCDVKGGVYITPEKINWVVTLKNQAAQSLPVDVKIEITDPYGKTTPLAKNITLTPDETQTVSFQPVTKVNGLHTVKTTILAANWHQSRTGTFLRVPAYARKATPLNSPWGVWTWEGIHSTNPDREENARMLAALGAINHYDLDAGPRNKDAGMNLDAFRAKWGLGPTHFRLIPRKVPDWGTKVPVDPKDYDTYKEEKGKQTKEILDKHPDFQYVNSFAENSVSLRLTHGIAPWALGQPWFEYEAIEALRIRQYLYAATAAAEGVKKYAPKVKFLFGHGAPNFAVPFFREKSWNPDLFAGFGLDMPQFERMPERQPRATEPSLLYFLKKEMTERGMADKEIVHLESYFPSSHELALGLRGQADNIVRTAVLSLALGTTKFMHTWSLQDCADRWGSQHYGSPGLISREPESFPKPAAAAFATMTRVLDLAKFDGWVDTGSRSAFCVRFKDKDRIIYAVWTIHGTRSLEIVADSNKATLVEIDENGNEFPLLLNNGKTSVKLTPTVSWIVASEGNIKSSLAGKPAYTNAPSGLKVVLDDFEKGGWTCNAGVYTTYASNNWDMVREPGKMTQEQVTSDERTSKVWHVTMAERPAGKPCVGFYGVFTPSKPIPIPGKAKAIGIFGKGRSQWHRLVYELVDAKGEVWLSCGVKNAWNSDDIHSWSYFNHDGWRYMEFPLPASTPGDNSREKSMYSWGGSDDGIVDLPLSLTKVIVEMRTAIIYANEMLPVDDLSLDVDDLSVVYETQENMTDAPVKLQVAAKNVWRPSIKASILPNPIKKLMESGVGTAPVIEKMYPPEIMASGDQVFVKVKPVEGAQKYKIYVAAYSDGAGAQAAPGKVDKDPSLIFVSKLQPAIPLYFFASYTDKEGKESKPSAVRKTVLRDEFPFK